MGWSPPYQVAVAFLLLFMVTWANAQTSAVCPTFEKVVFDEYPNIKGIRILTAAQIDASNYTQLLFASSVRNLNLTLTYLEPREELKGISAPEVLKIQYRDKPQMGYYVTLKLGIDRDGTSAANGINSVEFLLECSASANEGKFNVFSLSLNDLNDNAPQFNKLSYEKSINELMPVGTTVLDSITATDLDNGNNRIIEYKLKTANTDTESDKFQLASPDSTFIILKGALDYDALAAQGGPVHLLNITATDKPDRYPKQTSWRLITIRVTDGNDLGPVFIYSSCTPSVTGSKSCIVPRYTTSIATDTTQPVGSKLTFLPVPRLPNNAQTVEILARDRDSLNASLTCSIQGTKPEGFKNNFVVTTDATNAPVYQCNVRVQVGINRALVSSMEVYVVVTEQSARPYSEAATIELTVTPKNTRPPILTTNSNRFEGYIREDSNIGMPVLTSATSAQSLRLIPKDPDLSSTDPAPEFDISLVPASMFTVNDQGQVVLLNRLDYETKQSYNFDVVVTQRNVPSGPLSSSTSSLTIFVLDVNDRPPQVPAYGLSATVREGNYTVGIGEFIVDLKATDPDNAGLVYEVKKAQNDITKQDVSAGFFIVNPQGNVLLRGNVVAEQRYLVVVNVTDKGSPPLSTQVTVIVDVLRTGNRGPQFDASQFTIYVSEGVNIQSSLWTIPVSDPEKDTLTVRIERKGNRNKTRR